MYLRRTRIRRIAARAGLYAAVLALAAPGAALAQASAGGEQCRPLSRAAGEQTDEGASCVSVALRMSQAPVLGEQVRVDIEVSTTLAESDVRLEIQLPAGLVWAEAPSGLHASTAASLVPVQGGRVHRAEGAGRTGRERPWRLRGTVRAVAPGAAGIRASATSAADAEDTDSSSVFLTIGAQRSAFGIPVRDVAELAPAAPGAGRAHARLDHQPAEAAVSGQASATSVAAGSACATGSWNYVDHGGVTRVSANARVVVYDDDARGADDLLATGLTGADGRFHLCFDNTEEDGSGQDVYVQFATENQSWIVRNGKSRQPYRFASGVRADVATGTTADLGAVQPADAALMRGVEAFDTVNAGWNWKPGSTCWDQRDTTCRRGIVNWAPDSTDGTYYSLQGNAVHLAAEDPDAPILVLHEFGHALMDDVYEDAFPSSPNCSPHYITRTSSAGCAWTEGFATWFGVVVLDDPTFRWPGGRTQDLEGPTWGTNGWDNGDTVEGRVLGAMIDLADTANEPGDNCAEEPAGPLWNTFLDHVSVTFAQFWAHRAADGYDVGAGALDCLHHNTIDYRG
ncbi:transthyretin-like family protein [Streptomyces sp. APSN-46.1]|uniref:transthyretin-like family protein n=1 Tax=Streptomyces sp. APSN-46.1 TaxID=2929049 RepID=UPI001FB4E04F|nr:transthyretin-like family protein [Streptomyces sp. APSN-46.1]MCJ1676161.1 transthyretin-like family protein [Streptomyces sp. APSN-46.1]